MRVVLDTNVLVSGIFFAGVPGRLLEAWADDKYELVLSPSIFDEYLRACARLAESRSGLEYEAVLATIVGHGTLVADAVPGSPSRSIPTTTSSCSARVQRERLSFPVTAISSTSPGGEE